MVIQSSRAGIFTVDRAGFSAGIRGGIFAVGRADCPAGSKAGSL